MIRYILGRLFGIAVVMVIVSIIIFGLMHAIPGGPFDEAKMPLPAAAKANILRKYGLDKPLYEQYGRYVWAALHGDFGIPFQSPTETVTGLIARTWPVSFKLGMVTLAFALPLGILAGVLAAMRQNSWIDYSASFLSSLGLTIPNFVISVWLILLLSVQWKFLPTGGWGSWQHYIMPVIALGLAPMALTARYTRSSLLEVKRADYVRTAHAKGLSPNRVLWRHSMKNALIPLITVLGPQVPNLITGTIFVESIFRIPGLGKFFVTSIFRRDYPMIMGTLLLVALVWSVVYLITDVLYMVVDPRVRLDKKSS
ncbi:MAG: ABC transporter permease [Caldilineaceae bacterium]|nr:ABC transporter permease [Caldilineaceae bacterium]MBP8109275.1 ABC transporter permease [Caldilineaceae bacterium]MBP8123894.1 ABC transporter permease [Caldilineaceae bacterium]MBP9071823.1 ABC transporter permease [Caldilineaceae bacterium]